jgi:YbbR domain-containing protein
MFSRLRSILFKNWIPKLACLAFAFGLWFWVAIQQTGQSQYEVPVEFRNKPQDLYITDQSTRNVIVTLQGPKTSLYRTSSSDITASIDLRGQSEGTKTFWSSELTIRHPK